MNSSGSSTAPSMPVPRHYYQLELRPHDRIASTFHSGFESRPLLCPDWSSALLAFPSTPAPSIQLRHDRQALLLMIRQALFIRHFFGSRLLSIDLADLIERITARLGIDLLQIVKLSSGVCQATA